MSNENTYLKAFFANETMAEAVKLALMEATDDNLAADIPTTIDDAEYGRKVKVWAEARKLIERRFNDLKRSVESNPQPDVGNEAR